MPVEEEVEEEERKSSVEVGEMREERWSWRTEGGKRLHELG